jgi:hypothetical protein
MPCLLFSAQTAGVALLPDLHNFLSFEGHGVWRKCFRRSAHDSQHENKTAGASSGLPAAPAKNTITVL